MSEHDTERERQLARRTKRLFDDSVAGLDAATRSRLNRARQRALAELAPAKTSGWRWSLVPAGGVAVAAVMALLLVWQPQQEPPTEAGLQQVAALGDLEILLGEEDLEMLNQEIEFYGWLEEQPEFAGSGDSVG
jgi:hypothetical protein